MTKIKKAAPIGTAHNKAQNNSNLNCNKKPTLTPRLTRLGIALLNGEPTPRDLIDIIPANNPAEYVRQLRADYGIAVLSERVKFTTIDGIAGWHGRYLLTELGRKKLKGLVMQGLGS